MPVITQCPKCGKKLKAPDQKVGAAGTVVDTLRDPRLLHHVEVVGGVLADDSIALLQDFFDDLR